MQDFDDGVVAIIGAASGIGSASTVERGRAPRASTRPSPTDGGGAEMTSALAG